MEDEKKERILYCGWHPESGFEEETLSLSEEVAWRKIKFGDHWDLKPEINLGGIIKEMESIGWNVQRVLICNADAILQMEEKAWMYDELG